MRFYGRANINFYAFSYIFCMKIFGFKTSKENKFVNITCNFILVAIVLVVLSLSFLSPVSVDVFKESYSAIYSGNKNKNNISLMINVYWGDEYLDDMLSVLEKNNAKVTFFVGGSWAVKNTEMLLKMSHAGHEIGNHGYNHKDHVKISDTQAKNEIEMTGKVVYTATGKQITLFAPPSGSVNSNVVKLANKLGYKTIMWSKDTIDWRDKDSSLVYKRSTNNAQNGDLILMHPTKHTLDALDKICKTLKDNGFNLTTVSENIAD